jgi:hypothetical protein
MVSDSKMARVLEGGYVVKWVLDSCDFLVGFVAFAGDQDDVSGLGQLYSKLDGLGAVADSKRSAFLNGV